MVDSCRPILLLSGSVCHHFCLSVVRGQTLHHDVLETPVRDIFAHSFNFPAELGGVEEILVRVLSVRHAGSR